MLRIPFRGVKKGSKFSKFCCKPFGGIENNSEEEEGGGGGRGEKGGGRREGEEGRGTRVARNFVSFRASEWALLQNSECPRNEHFLPRNNGICSESIQRNFFGTKFCCQP